MISKTLKRLAKTHPTKSKPVSLTIDRRQVLRGILIVCAMVIAALVYLDFLINYSSAVRSESIQQLFNITREDSLASWFSVAITTLVALTMWALWLLARASGAPKFTRTGWLTLAICFSYLAVDDGSMIHERVGTTAGEISSSGWLNGFPTYYWQAIFVPVLAIFGAYLLYFMMRTLSTRRQRLAVIAALGCLAVAVILDFFEGMSPDNNWNIYTAIANNFDFAFYAQWAFGKTEYDTLVHFSKSLEESLETLAMSLILVTSLAHLTERYPKITVSSATPTSAKSQSH